MLSFSKFRAAGSILALLLLPLASASAVPPPPVPQWFKAAGDNIAKVKEVIGGEWVGKDPPLSPSVELSVGAFGSLAPHYLLLDRTQNNAGPYSYHTLSALFYSTNCQAFQMLSLDGLSNPGPVSIADCSRSFPIDFHPDGSLSFQYTDWNLELVSVVANKEALTEIRYTPGITDKREIDFVRSLKPAAGTSFQ